MSERDEWVRMMLEAWDRTRVLRVGDEVAMHKALAAVEPLIYERAAKAAQGQYLQRNGGAYTDGRIDAAEAVRALATPEPAKEQPRCGGSPGKPRMVRTESAGYGLAFTLTEPCRGCTSCRREPAK